MQAYGDQLKSVAGLRQVSVIVTEPVSVFEFAVAVEVFGLDRRDEGIQPFDFRICAAHPDRPLVTKGVTPFSLTATHGLEGVEGSDLVVVSATAPRGDSGYPPQTIEAIRAAHAAGATLLSMCTGAYLIGAAGLLDGRRATTHWMYSDHLQTRFPKATIDPNVLYVDDGNIVTSAGTAAGVDASLYLIRRELGQEIATRIARRMVVPPHRDGGQLQFVDAPLPIDESGALGGLLAWITDHLAVQHTAASLAARVNLSERTFARRFLAETGTTPHRWVNQQRVLQARRLLEETDLGVDQIADRVGFNSSVVLRDHFRRHVGLTPGGYRRQFGQMQEA